MLDLDHLKPANLFLQRRIIPFKRIFHYKIYKPSIWGYPPWLWRPSYVSCRNAATPGSHMFPRGHRHFRAPALAASNSLRTAPSNLAASSVRATAKRCASADSSTWDDERWTTSKVIWPVWGWPTPLKNMKVSWDDYSNVWKKQMFQTTNQDTYISYICIYLAGMIDFWFRWGRKRSVCRQNTVLHCFSHTC